MKKKKVYYLSTLLHEAEALIKKHKFIIEGHELTATFSKSAFCVRDPKSEKKLTQKLPYYSLSYSQSIGSSVSSDYGRIYLHSSSDNTNHLLIDFEAEILKALTPKIIGEEISLAVV